MGVIYRFWESENGEIWINMRSDQYGWSWIAKTPSSPKISMGHFHRMLTIEQAEKQFETTIVRFKLKLIFTEQEPKCSTCGMGAVRHKCFFEMEDCPRYEVRRKWSNKIKSFEIYKEKK